MRLFLLLLFANLAFAQASFGTPYLSKSRLCHQWACVNKKLGLPESLPPREQTTELLNGILPAGAWRGLTDRILDVCYENRTRRYTNTCPGQGLMHCVLDQMIENCPEESLRKDDVCSPVTSLSGVKYMFSQSMYENLKENLVTEIRPEWFFRNYFKSKCCVVPPLISLSTQMECGFTTILQIFSHSPRHAHGQHPQLPVPKPISKPNADHVNIVRFQDAEIARVDIQNLDPLDCCDISEFIQPSWRRECDFHMKWNSTDRLSIDISQGISTTAAPSTTIRPKLKRDFMVVPQDCEKTSCVFKKLNIASDAGVVDVKSFIKLLDNFTEVYPFWNTAKSRVISSCLRKSLLAYDGECELNKILACTFDVLSENCPFGSKKNSSCKRGSRLDAECQISSSKFRPKHRRDPCSTIPELIKIEHLAECNISSLSRIEFAPEPAVRTKKTGLDMFKYQCKGQSLSTTCLLDKMAVLNKYTFMDYFKMKDRIRKFTTNPEWTLYTDGLLSAFSNMPMYQQYCSSPKKLLNVVDAMMMTCPATKRQNTPQCRKLFTELSKTVPPNFNLTESVVNHFNRIFLPVLATQRPMRRFKPINRPKNTLYQALLNTDSAPQVAVIDVPTYVKQPLVLKPVYLRPKFQNPILTPYGGDKVLRSPFWLHEQIAAAHTNGSVAREQITTKPTSLGDSVQFVTP